MWVPRTPRPADFCGCPPCPLCFCWAGDNGLVDGITQFKRDILEGREPTAEESKTLDDAAERIHAGNLAAPQEIERQYQELQAKNDAQFTELAVNRFLEEKRRQVAPPKVDTRPTLDEIGGEAIEKTIPKPRKERETVFMFGPPPGFIEEFLKISQRDIAKSFYASTTFIDTAGNEFCKPELTATEKEKENRRMQAEADAKKRMKNSSREPVRR